MRLVWLIALVLALVTSQAKAAPVCVLLSGDTTAVIAVNPPCNDSGVVTIDTTDVRWTAWLAQHAAQNGAQSYLSQYRAQIAKGVALTSTGTPALNATYPLTDEIIGNIQGLYFRAKTIGTNFGPDGVSSVNLYDMAGQGHAFNSTQIINYGDGVAAYLATLAPQVVGPPGNQGWPASPAITIP